MNATTLLEKTIRNFVEGVAIPLAVDDVLDEIHGQYNGYRYYTDCWDEAEFRYRTEAVTDTLLNLLGKELTDRGMEIVQAYVHALPHGHKVFNTEAFLEGGSDDEWVDAPDALGDDVVNQLVEQIVALVDA